MAHEWLPSSYRRHLVHVALAASLSRELTRVAIRLPREERVCMSRAAPLSSVE